jgi:leucyl-tRNA synthetase
MKKYDHKAIERRWQKEWEKNKIYTAPDKAPGKDNFYLLVEFPYPSGNLHVGHWYAFAVPDILARYQRMRGNNVLYPIGFDAFGLPAENAAIKRGINPRTWTEDNIAYMKKQIGSMGASFDWSREVQTIDPGYYKWTQWMFLQFFKNGLAYRKETAVNWCPKDKTVLANEQVIDGKCERCGSEVIQRQMLQWNLKITDYADRLIDDLERLDWPEQIKESQRNWIGRSEGYEVLFPLQFGANKTKQKYVLLHGFHGKPSDLGWIAEKLRSYGHEVIVPELPNADAPTEKEWVEAALQATSYDKDTVLFGYSLGAATALKVVERLDVKIASLVLAGGFVDPKFADTSRNFEKKFKWTFDVPRIKKTVGRIQFLHDTTDKAVSKGQAERLGKLFDIPITYVQAQKSHFTGENEMILLNYLVASIIVFTTRSDTLYGGTYLVLAPEHPWVTLALGHKTVLSNNAEVAAYVAQAKKKTELERQTGKDKTGVELKGVKAINPTTGAEMPLWIGDFAIATFGTGALFGDAHDERDVEFAKKFNIPLKETIEPLTVQKTGLDTFREHEAANSRHAVLAVVKHWSEDKYLAVQYKPTDVRGFVSGGVEEGEDEPATAAREVREETGYSSARFVRKLGGTIHSKYFSLKYGNLHVRFTPLLMQLENDAREEISPKEKEEHNVSWMTPKEIEAFINRGDMKAAWERVKGDTCYTGKGILFDSDEFSGLTSDEAIPKVGEKFGRKVKQYRLRDWIVSRQRYWGVPIPIIHCLKCGTVAVPDKALPVKLPEVKDYLPEGTGKSPLAKVKKFVEVNCPQCKGKAERETDTFDTFVDSSWYFLRYTDPKNKKKFADGKKLEQWMPVDLYSGGAEHTTVHVLYSRFWQKALYDLGFVADPEPYTRRMNRSLIMGPDGQKMSKSRGNVIDPDEVVSQLGADTVRMYLAFIGPYNEVSNYPWNPDGVVGVRRFLERVWRAQEYVGAADNEALENSLHKTIKKVGDDIVALKFNTAISALMIFLNAVDKETLRQAQGKKALGKGQWERFLQLLAPFAPHMAEELWAESGQKKSIHKTEWPSFDEARLKDDTITIAVQINGKTRSEASVPSDADKAAQEAAAKEAIADRMHGKKILRTIVVPGRLVNFVTE